MLMGYEPWAFLVAFGVGGLVFFALLTLLWWAGYGQSDRPKVKGIVLEKGTVEYELLIAQEAAKGEGGVQPHPTPAPAACCGD